METRICISKDPRERGVIFANHLLGVPFVNSELVQSLTLVVSGV